MLKFVLVRLGIFAGILAIFLLLGFDPYFSTAVAAMLGLSISLLFFNKQRGDVSEALYNWTQRRADRDTSAEDSAEDTQLDDQAGPKA